MTDGAVSYSSLFPEIFGIAYFPPRQGTTGRFPNPRYRIPRTLAHAQVVKRYSGKRLVEVKTVKAHGSWKRIEQGLVELGYNQPNTSAVERFNATARRMNAHQVRRSLAFAHCPQTRQALAWWSACVYNWGRPHRSLRHPLELPQGKQLYQARTPAMAMGLSNEIWNAADLLRCVVYPAVQTV